MDKQAGQSEPAVRMHTGFRALGAASQALSGMGVDPAATLAEVARVLAEAVQGCACVLLCSADGERLSAEAISSQSPSLTGALLELFSPAPLLAENPLLRQALDSQAPILVETLEPGEPRFSARGRRALERAGTARPRSLMAISLRAEGRPIGVLLLLREASRALPFDEADLELARSVAELLAFAIAGVRAVERSRAEQLSLSERLQALVHSSAELATASHDQNRLLDVVARRLTELVGDMCVIRPASADGEWLESAGSAHFAAPEALEVLKANTAGRQRLGEGISGRALETARPELLASVTTPELLLQIQPKYRTIFERLEITSMMTVPLRCRGVVVGVANLLRRQPRAPYGETDLQLVQSVADYAALALFTARAADAEQASKRAAEAARVSLEKAEARFATLSNSGIIGIIASRFDRSVLAINDTLLALLGYTREEILSGRVAWASLTPPEWQEIDEGALEQLSANALPPLREKEYLRKDGQRVPVLVGSARVKSTDEIISFVLDLTERRQSQTLIAQMRNERAAEARFAALLEAAPDGMLIADDAGHITLVNAQLERLFGYTRAELIGHPTQLLIPRGADDADLPAVTGAALSGRRKDGSEFPIEVSSSLLQTEGGTLVSSSIRDVTGRRRAEQLHSDLAAIVEASDDAIIGKTLSGKITSWNPGAHRLFGYSAQEAIGQSMRFIIPPAQADEEPVILEAMARGEVRRFETVRRRKDGRDVDVSVTSSPVRDALGAVVGISKVARDITLRKQADALLARAKEAAEAAGRELEAFSYSVAHDLRAPLRGMNGFARVLLDTYGSSFNDEGRDWLEEIVLNAKRMGSLIDALLSLSQVNRADFNRETVDLGALARASLATLQQRQPERAVELLTEGDLRAELDPNLARALIDNLLGNAFKFTGQRPLGHIVLAAKTVAETRIFSIRDDGAGFDMAFADKLFAPFQRLHRSTEFPGTGIGLATAYRIVRRHGGHIWAEGATGEGAKFSFTLATAAMGATP